MYTILSINPGATSTKVSVYEDDKPIFVETIRHTVDELKDFEKITDQYHFRASIIEDVLKSKNFDISTLDAVVGRGGPFKPLESGTYPVTQKMMDDVVNGNVVADHISNIGCLLAHEIAEDAEKAKGSKVPAYIVDPVSVDEFIPEARVSGLPEIERVSLAHALNIKMVAKKFAKDQNKSYSDMNLVITHLGGGITVSSHKAGRMIDVNNANDEGPFSPQRVGTLPVTQLAKLCYSGKYPDYHTMKKHLIKQGGLHALVGVDDLRDVIKLIEKGDKNAELCFNAMAYQIAKSIGSYSAVLDGKVDAIIITGGIANNERMMNLIKSKVDWIADVFIYPGEDEMEALTKGAIRVLDGEEEKKVY